MFGKKKKPIVGVDSWQAQKEGILLRWDLLRGDEFEVLWLNDKASATRPGLFG